MTGCRGHAFFLLSLGILFAFASFDRIRGLAAPVEGEAEADTLLQLEQNIDTAPERDVGSSELNGASEAVLTPGREEQQEVKVENELEPEEAPDDFKSDEASDSRPIKDRPRTTKRLYTTRHTAKGAAAGSGLSGVKVFSLLAMLLMGVVVYAFRGKIFSPEEEDAHDDDDDGGGQGQE